VSTETQVPAGRVCVREWLQAAAVPAGKAVRIWRIFYACGPRNGRAIFLPIDQGFEHGPRDFLTNPPSGDPEYQLRLALEGDYSAIVFEPGLARKYHHAYAGRVPLVLKLNGKTNIPSDAEAFSPLTASVEEAVALGADAVGYTLYVGSPAQGRDIPQLAAVRRDCDRFGMPLMVWSYPRGEAVDKTGGRDSLYAIDYAARVACEMGADLVKLNMPKPNQECPGQPEEYARLDLDARGRMGKVIRSAGRTLVLVSGGSKLSDEDVLEKARVCFEAGAAGLIFGRNMWQRPMNEALQMTRRIHDLTREFGDDQVTGRA